MTIYFFGRLTELTGNTVYEIPAVQDTDELKTVLFHHFPTLASATFVLSVNKKIVRDNTAIDGQAEIAVLPPFSGG